MTHPLPTAPAAPAAPTLGGRPRTPARSIAIRGATAVLGGIVLLSGTGGVIGYFMQHDSTRTMVFSEPVTQVRVQADTGQVRISAGARGQGSTVTSRAVSAFRTAEHHESVQDGVLQVSTGCRGSLALMGDSCSVDFDIVVPPGTAVNVTTSTGDVNVSGTGEAVNVRSDTGDVHVDKSGGLVRLASNTGDLSAEELTGERVSATTDTGDIELEFDAAPNQVEATSETGDLHVVVPRDGTLYQVQADSSLEEPQLDLPRSSASSRVISLRTDSGTIEAETD